MSNLSEQASDTRLPLQRLALVGSPNSGKSTLFNALTGLRTKVANYPGVTVEHLEGELKLDTGQSYTLMDLPGTYSLEALSPEEQVAIDILQGEYSDKQRPDGILFVADTTTLPRTLPLLGSLMTQTTQPIILVLTMLDEIKARGGMVRPTELQQALGIPVRGIVGNKGIGLEDLKSLLSTPKKWERKPPKEIPPTETQERFEWADRILEKAFKAPEQGTLVTDKLDRVLLHPVGGLLVFAAVMLFFFQAIFSWAGPLQDLMTGGVEAVGKWLLVLPPGWLRSLMIDGVVAGVGSVVVFVPQIALLFLLISFLEQIGYMSRAVFLIDRLMGWVGLDGRSFVSMLSSHACAIPGIMAARSIPDPRNRLVTILVAPFMTCSARLPVYALLIAAFIPKHTIGGFLNLQGLVLFGLYLLGTLGALVSAFVLRRGPMRGATLPFYIELPPYRLPTFKVMFSTVANPVSSFVKRAGTLIFAASIILWVLLNFPKVQAPTHVVKQGPEAVASYKIERSMAAHVGKTIEPVIAPLGFDWKIGVGLVASLAAREVIVATMAQTYAVKVDEENTKALRTTLQTQLKPPHVKKPTPQMSLAVALSLLMFFVFALQCFSTLAVMHRETGTWRWPVLAFVSMSALAYIASFVTYRLVLWLT